MRSVAAWPGTGSAAALPPLCRPRRLRQLLGRQPPTRKQRARHILVPNNSLSYDRCVAHGGCGSCLAGSRRLASSQQQSQLPPLRRPRRLRKLLGQQPPTRQQPTTVSATTAASPTAVAEAAWPAAADSQAAGAAYPCAQQQSQLPPLRRPRRLRKLLGRQPPTRKQRARHILVPNNSLSYHHCFAHGDCGSCLAGSRRLASSGRGVLFECWCGRIVIAVIICGHPFSSIHSGYNLDLIVFDLLFLSWRTILESGLLWTGDVSGS